MPTLIQHPLQQAKILTDCMLITRERDFHSPGTFTTLLEDRRMEVQDPSGGT